MNTPHAETCEHCGAQIHNEAYCPSCGSPLRMLFADEKLLERCTSSLVSLEEVLHEIPPLYGWSILLIWFGVPLAILVGIGIGMGGVAGWLIGIAAAVFFFLIQVPGVALLREKIFYRQYNQVVRPRIGQLMETTKAQADDLILLARQVESLQKSVILKYLEEEQIVLKSTTPSMPENAFD